MKKLLIAATGALIAFAPMSAIASSRSAVVAATAVAYCGYENGHFTLDEATAMGAAYLDKEGISTTEANRIMDSATFNDEVLHAIALGGGCDKITEDF